MLDWALGGLGSLFGLAGDAVGAVAGWAWEKVTQGIYTWLANGLALLIEWVWGVLDTATTPRVTEDWFRNELAGQVMVLSVAVTVAMMLASAIQAALAGRPEQITDAVKEGARAVVASAFTLTAIDVMIGVVDEASMSVWQVGREDLVRVIEGMVFVATATGPLGDTFVGPLCLLLGFVGLIGLTVSLFMRNVLIYMTAALAPLVWSSSVLPMMRGSSRRLVHLLVALIVSKLAIVITLVLGVKLIANVGGDPETANVANDAAAAVGMLITGFLCFVVAALSPFVLYKLMPTVEGAVASSGIAGGWGRGAMTMAQAGMMAKGMGQTAATRPVAGQGGADGADAAGAAASGAAGSVKGLAVATGAAAAGTVAGGPAGSGAGAAAGGSASTGGSAAAGVSTSSTSAGASATEASTASAATSQPATPSFAPLTDWDEAARSLHTTRLPTTGDDDEQEQDG